MRSAFFLAVLVLKLCCFSGMASLELAPYPLPGRLYPSKYVTVSGNEAGGVFAQMMHFTHSKYIKGCGALSTNMYRCGPANGNPDDYRNYCTSESTTPWTVAQVVAELKSYDSTHVIDNLRYMRDSKLYVYVSLENEDFSSDQQLSPPALYERYLASPYLIYVRAQDTSESLRVINASEPEYATCPKHSKTSGEVSTNCTSLSVPAEALGFLLERTYLNYINPFYPHFRYAHLEPLRTFNQTEFLVGLEYPGLDEIGYYYVPRYCQLRAHAHRNNYGHHNYAKPCLVHVYFHGCQQGREFQGTSHVMYSNYLEIAELNYIIMLFPQTLSSVENPTGCWDIIGMTGVLYATKSGPQVQAVWRMLERLLYLMPERTTATYYRASSPRGKPTISGSGGSNTNIRYREEQKSYPSSTKYANNPNPNPSPYPSPSSAPTPAPSPAPTVVNKKQFYYHQ